MVGGQDDDAVVVDAGRLDAVHDALHPAVHERKLGIELGGTLSIGMAHVVQGIDVDEAERRFLVHDILHALLHDGFRIRPGIVDPDPVVHAQGVGIVEEVAPFADDAGFSLGPGLLELVEDGRLGVVLRQDQRFEIRRSAVARDTRRLDGRSVHHRAPVGTARGREYGPLVQGPGTLLHHFLDERGLPFFHAPGSPAVQADEDDMGGEVRLFGLRLCAGNGEKRRQDN